MTVSAVRSVVTEAPPALAGLYEIWLDQDAPAISVELPVYVRPDMLTGVDRKFLLSATKGEMVYTLVCTETGCGKMWEPKWPPLPGDMLARPENMKLKAEFKDSYYCPKCLEAKNRRRGRRAKFDEGQAAQGRRVRPRYMLTSEDAGRLLKCLDPNLELVPAFETLQYPDGIRKVQRGYSQSPLVYVWTDRDGVEHHTPYGEFVRYKLVDGDTGHSEIDKAGWQDRQRKIAGLDKELLRLGGSLTADEKKNKAILDRMVEIGKEKLALVEA